MTTKTTTEPLSDERLESIRSHAESWREIHAVQPDELMDIDALLGEVDRLRALLATVRTNQVGLARAYAETSTREARRAGKFKWTPAHSAAYAQGEARGAVNTAQFLLMGLGEVEYDEAAETTWEVVMSRDTDV